MSSFRVLVPVKSSGVKSRLSPLLSKAERERLGRLLLSGVLKQLGTAGLLGSTRVVSSDPQVLEFAAKSGARTVREARDEGVNSAVEKGMHTGGSPARVLVLPADLALFRASEVKHVVSLGDVMEVVIAPSVSFNGTNALLFPPSAGLTLSYDDDSFWNHIRAAARKGLSVGVTSEPGLMFDLDTPDDLRSLARSRSKNPVAEFARRVTR